MSVDAIAILVTIGVIGVIVITILSVWAIATLTANLKNERKNKEDTISELKARIAKLEDADADKIPVNSHLYKEFIDEIQAHGIAMQEHARVQRELLHQLRRGNVRIDKKNNGN